MSLNNAKNKSHTDIQIGEIVYLITDDEQKERMVTSYTVYPNGIIYTLSQGINISNHYIFEITRGKSYKFN